MIYKDPEQPVAGRVTDPFSRMSIEEKLAQLQALSYTQFSSVNSLPHNWRTLSDCNIKLL